LNRLSFRLLALLGTALLGAACGKPVALPPADAGAPTALPPPSCLDNDGDGFPGTGNCAGVARVDCNDQDPAVYPGAPELCDGLDNDCDGVVDNDIVYRDFFVDADGDGYGAKGSPPERRCEPTVAGKVANQTDCDDSDPAIHPGATEVCNGADDNCNGTADEGLTFSDYYPDFDLDTYGSKTAAPVRSCKPLAGKVANNTDCNDNNAAIHPGATELCNNLDDNCNAQIDEGNPGGGGACSTGQFGVCAAGTLTCQTGTLNCVRNSSPSAEVCDGLDNDCNNQVDETFPNKGLACSAGLGVCARPGTYQCKADKSGTECPIAAGAPTAAACDGLDNDCDGIVDEPFLASTQDLGAVAWQAIEFAPWYYSAGGCAGGVNGTGTDALAGGALAMAKGSAGIALQRLDSTGALLGVATQPTSLSYTDVGIAQAGDAYLIAGLYGASPELDLYLMDAATGAERTHLWSQFNAGSGNSIDSLRVVRGNGNRVVLLWREVVGTATRLRLARVQPNWDGTSWTIRNAGGAVAPITSAIVPTGTTVLAGLGADSSHDDTGASQTCPAAAGLRNLMVSYLSSAQSLNAFGIWEDGSGKSAETVIRTETSPRVLAEPEVTFFRAASADQFFIGYVTQDPGTTPPQADLDFYMTNATSWHYAYLTYATQNGVASIRRPRASATPTHVFVSALRYVADATAFKRQVMTRNIDLTGARDPSSTTVELSATQGGCGTDPACRPGDKDGLTSWAAKGRLFYSGSGSSPMGTYSSALTCQ
jgi:hypothetical protein